ncbi:MAG: protein-glutamine gamma-glutamyltransferase [Gammaproteobacteria bacterium]|jgi:transglutaminase-like putative cysteine protease|nr:protein-glutamine gamma-glutamyltransferase [Gammaproteobacteria bacterium]
MSAASRSGALTPAAERVTFDSLLWISACLALTLLVGIATLPIWVTLTVAGVAAIRLVRAARGQDAPPRSIRLGLAALAVGLLFLQFRTFNGLNAGTALLTLIAGLKLLETRTRRDIYVITMIIYFLSLAALLEGESLWLLSYLIAVCWLTTSTLLRLTSSARNSDWRGSVRHAGRILAQALPLAVAFWLFFPRFGGPLWQMPDSGGTATSGLSDSMSPGDINKLAMSDEVAFRVRFKEGSGTPPPQERYWRGPVLHDFDGHTWRRTESAPVVAPGLRFQGPAYRYTVSLEPSQHNWIFVLDWPSRWDAERAYLTSDYMLMEPNPLSQPIDVTATSYSHVQAAQPLGPGMRRRDTHVHAGRNPRSLRLAQELRSAHPDDVDLIGAVLAMFHSEAFFYTLTPPRLAADPVDEFLFDTKRGFCGHYASAFAMLMRAAGIPARVVTGYQGGTYNRFADYWIVRQSDAHAWDEVWIEGRGWVRVDPTTAIAPERVEHGLNDMVTEGAPQFSRWQQRTPWLADLRLRLDALRLLWRERILRFDESSQERLLELLHIPDPDGQKVALVLAGCLILGLTWLTWQVRRELKFTPRDPLQRAYERLCRRLGSVRCERMPAEGPEAYAARVSLLRPDLAAPVTALCREYSTLRYGAGTGAGVAAADTNRFSAAVRRFRPRGSRGSS